MKRNERGVTLIALVVTIVVLLILAGTAIAMLSGDDGIMTNAQKAQAANTEGEVREKFSMAYNAIKTKISVDSAIDPAYNATSATTIKELFQEAVEEIGLEYDSSKAVATDNTGSGGYTITYAQGSDPKTSTVIYLEYRDNKFGGAKKAVLESATTGNAINQTHTNGNQKIDGNQLHQINAKIVITTDNAELQQEAKQVL